MSKKKIEVFKIRIKTVDESELNFEDILLNKDITSQSIKDGAKHIELVYVEERGDYIVGLVQSTKMNATPPKHNVDTNVVSSLGLSDPEGLVYGNVFLYSKKSKFFLYEVTKDGLFAGQLGDHIYNITKGAGLPSFDIRFEIIMNIDAMKKLLTMGSKKSIHMQFAAPEDILKKVKNAQQSIKEIAKPGKELGAELIDVVYKITSRKSKSLHVGKVDQMLEWITNNYALMKDNVRKFAIKGYEEDEEKLTEVDLIKDKMIEFISYSENKNMDDLRPMLRKQEIIEAYERIEGDINKYLNNDY